MIIGIDASRAVVGQRTGTEAYATFLIQALIPLAGSHGHRLRLYFNAPPAPALFPDAPHVERVVIPMRRLWTHVRLGRELRARPPDVFFTPAHVIPAGYHGESVATVHDLGYKHFPEAHPWRQRAYLDWSTRHNSRAARRVLADSRATRGDLLKFYGTDPGKVAVVYPGADPTLQRVNDRAIVDAACARYGIRPPYLLYLGTLQPRKNLVRLIEAFATAGLHDSGYSLVLAGRAGWLAGPILAVIDRLPAAVKPHVILPGYITEADKASLLSGAAALAFPSLYEGFGFPVLEAQACGTPVVCASTSSLPEVAGEGALLVDPLDVGALAAALQQVTADAKTATRLVESGYVNYRRFTWRRAAAEAMAALEAAARAATTPREGG